VIHFETVGVDWVDGLAVSIILTGRVYPRPVGVY
jgi:hypothetical protein